MSSKSDSSSGTSSDSYESDDDNSRRKRWSKSTIERQTEPNKMSSVLSTKKYAEKEPITKSLSRSPPPRSDRANKRSRERRSSEESGEMTAVVGKRFWNDKHRGPDLSVGDRYWRDDKKEEEEANRDEKEVITAKKRRTNMEDNINTRTGGAYIPPARLKMMQAAITDKSSVQYQRLSWEALKKSINGLINKVNISNINKIVFELCKENIVRGSGVLARSIIQAQAVSGTFTAVYAALVSIINTKYPQTGELILKRLVIQFRKGFKRNDKTVCLSSTRFIAHLINQLVAHELLALEIITLLLETPTEDSVEVAISFLKEAGQRLTEVSPRGMHAIFERLRSVLHESNLDNRIQYMIEVMHAIRKDHFNDYPAVVEELNLIDEEDQFTHMINLDDTVDDQAILDVFKYDEDFEKNEQTYLMLSKDIGSDSDDNSNGSSSDGSSDSDDEGEGEDGKTGESENKIVDMTETNLVALRRIIYLTIQSSLSYEECCHKILKLEFIKESQVPEICHMVVDCCAQERSYIKFFGLLAQRFCQLKNMYVEPFEQIFCSSYDSAHRMEVNKLRNVAKMFGHLLYSDAISWMVLAHIRLNEDETTASSRIFIKFLFTELSEYLGITKLYGRIKDTTLQDAFEGLFPRNNPRDTRFAINFFTTIGLGGLTDELREHLKNAPKKAEVVAEPVKSDDSSSSSSSSSSDSDSSSSSDSSSTSSSSSSTDSGNESGKKRKKRKGRHERSRVAEKEKVQSKPDLDQKSRRQTDDNDRLDRYNQHKIERKEHLRNNGRYERQSRRGDNEEVRRNIRNGADDNGRYERQNRQGGEEDERRNSKNDVDDNGRYKRQSRRGDEVEERRNSRNDADDNGRYECQSRQGDEEERRNSKNGADDNGRYERQSRRGDVEEERRYIKNYTDDNGRYKRQNRRGDKEEERSNSKNDADDNGRYERQNRRGDEEEERRRGRNDTGGRRGYKEKLGRGNEESDHGPHDRREGKEQYVERRSERR